MPHLPLRDTTVTIENEPILSLLADSTESAAMAAQAHATESSDRKASQARARAARAALRAAARAVPPELHESYAHLTLAEMRAHRLEVAEAEERIGYWQRVTNLRLEALRGNGADVDISRMNAQLATKSLDHARTKLMRTTHRSLPALPTLSALWTDLGSTDAESVLETTALDLAEYQAALAATTKAATAELIARYRQTPLDCLAILPA